MTLKFASLAGPAAVPTISHGPGKTFCSSAGSTLNARTKRVSVTCSTSVSAPTGIEATTPAARAAPASERNLAVSVDFIEVTPALFGCARHQYSTFPRTRKGWDAMAEFGTKLPIEDAGRRSRPGVKAENICSFQALPGLTPSRSASPSLGVDVMGITPDESLATIPGKLKRWT